MPQLEFTKDYTRKNGRVVKKGKRGIFTKEKAEELKAYTKVVGQETTKTAQKQLEAKS